jgi:acyl-CoA dehydrogenase
MAVRCYDLMLERSLSRKTFGKYLAEHGGAQEMIAESASDIEAARLLTLSCAEHMDLYGARVARGKISSIKVSVPNMTLRVVDRAVQMFGGAGVDHELPLARILVGLRTLRIADGPDAVHQRTVAKLELKKAAKRMKSKL